MTEDKGPTVETYIDPEFAKVRAFRALSKEELRCRVRLLEADLERMRGALEPFAKIGEWLGPKLTHLDPMAREAAVFTMNVETDTSVRTLYLPKSADFRRARQALEAKHD